MEQRVPYVWGIPIILAFLWKLETEFLLLGYVWHYDRFGTVLMSPDALGALIWTNNIAGVGAFLLILFEFALRVTEFLKKRKKEGGA